MDSNIKNLKKLLAFVFITTLLLVTMTGCLKKEQAAYVDKTQRQVVIYNMYDDEDVIGKMLEPYEKAHPYTKIVYKKFNNYEEYEKLILNELAEGEGPDVFAMPNSWFLKNRKKLVPMPAVQGNVDVVKANYVDVVVDDMVFADDGGIEQTWGLPMFVDTLALYYNDDHFEDKLPETGVPAGTWSGLVNNVISLNSYDDDGGFAVSGIALGTTGNISHPVDVLYSLMLQYGTVFYDELMSKGGFASVSSEEALKFYLSFADSSQNHYSWDKDLATGADYFDGDVSAFVRGEVSMMFGYSGMYDYLKSQRSIAKSKGLDVMDLNSIKIAPFPQTNVSRESTQKRDVYANYYSLGVAWTTDDSDTAWDVLTHLTGPDSERIYFEETHKATSRRDLINEQKMHPIYGVFADQVGFAESFPVADVSTYYTVFETLINTATSGRSVQTALKAANDKVNALLPVNGYRVPVNEEYVKELEE